ncbi:SMP-30/gluconolactonase/LRE family protein [Sphingomonas sp. CGMCC 1.13654]|uniref:SMP-30/gluconolactonase/LRE family protein n=1 Tax=Sphingomonas chungangi TaxID=2683589 RepID=A0A838L5M8_9SPHN|nr:SMP-30/gluconolactonase/LRE family protein [Sphingomonas chungangi]MBA2934793.1 SMP-30/gluconolactonase/LRE family protein [Sphingomonas chungangi]MVW58104.1 gluconolaconase [Sphingomonas chungangi]
MALTGWPRTLLAGLGLPEAPRPAGGGRFVFSDVWTGEVIECDPADGAYRILGKVPGRPNGLGWLPDGRLLAVSMQERRLFAVESGTTAVAADLSEIAGGLLNEMVVDRHGRAYVSDHNLAPGDTPEERHRNARPAGIILIDPTAGGSARRIADGLLGPNGMAITPDGEALIVAETGGERLTAFAIGPDGALSQRRTVAALGFAPDGIALDGRGRLWVASSYPTGRFARIANGLIDAEIGTEGYGGFACLIDAGHMLLLEAPVPTQPADRRGRIRMLVEPS